MMAVVQIDPVTFGFLDFRCGVEEADWVRPTFDAVVASMELVDPEQINAEREAALRRGQEWRSSLKLGQIHAALVPERYYRILTGNKDTGYMRVGQSRVRWQDRPGVSVEVQTRIVQEESYADSLAQFFLADDDSTEVWSIRTTLRPINGKGAPRTWVDEGLRTWVDDGVRRVRQIQLRQEVNIGGQKRETRVEVPPGYLSQVEAWLLPALLPIDAEVEYGFYAYNTQTRKMTYRTERVLPLLDGFIITTRMAPNEPAYDATYDANRQLVERQLGPKQRLVPTEPSEIHRIWAGRMAPSR